MKGCLLDTNLLVALLWPAHESHRVAQDWFHRNQRAQWCTCPLTQNAFVRLISNPAFSRDAVSPAEARAQLTINLESPRHRFVAASISFAKATEPFASRLRAHNQVIDAYLLGLALHHGLHLATFDRGAPVLAGAEHASIVALLGI